MTAAWTYRPLVWTGPRTPPDRRKSRWAFRAGWEDTLQKLDDEIWRLSGSQPVIEADFREGDLRIDGMPRANARQPDFPGVRVGFNTPNLGRLVYATDSYEFWQHNVRAIALSLEALRAVDRYGTTSGRQQYTGFRSLTAGDGVPTSREEAARFIAGLADPAGGGRDAIVALLLAGNVTPAFRVAAKRAHPDHGGSAEQYQRLTKAAELLRAVPSPSANPAERDAP